LRAFHLALKRFPELHRAVTLLQVVVPSRENVPQYQELKAQVERLVTQINGEFTQPGWVPIHHVFRSLGWEELLSYYRAADAALITPLKDGMKSCRQGVLRLPGGGERGSDSERVCRLGGAVPQGRAAGQSVRF
jgi:trehalose-6-phosphate synthase